MKLFKVDNGARRESGKEQPGNWGEGGLLLATPQNMTVAVLKSQKLQCILHRKFLPDWNSQPPPPDKSFGLPMAT
jgi:hypothetical protein